MSYINNTENSGLGAVSSYELVAAVLLALSAFVFMGKVLVRSHYGFDLTDEGFYLHMIANPKIYGATVSQFGFVYHPLYKIVNGDVALIRQINYLVTFGLAWIMCLILFCRAFVANKARLANKILLLALSAVIASSSFLVTSFELPQSPSYNTLAYQALLLGVIGIILADNSDSRVSFGAYVLIGVSWWLAFLAKPPTAVALGLVGLLYFLISGKLRLRSIFVSTTTAAILLFGTALVIDGSMYSFVQRLTKGIEVGRVLASGNSLSSIWRWDKFPLSGNELDFLLLSSVVMSFIILLSFSESRGSRIATVVIGIIFAIASVAISADGLLLGKAFERYFGVQILALPIACLIVSIPAKVFLSIRREDIALITSLLLIPHAYAFGTDRPYWLNAQSASLFWILSGVLLFSVVKMEEGGWRVLLPVSGGVSFMTALFLYASMEYPMRQTQPQRLNVDIVEIGQQGNTLLLSRDFAEYIWGLRQLARSGDLQANTPIIDLTGRSPGAVYALNGTPPGVPWLLGGYKGSDAFAIGVLDMVPCTEIARAWVIIEPYGPGRLSVNLLKRYGIDLELHYQNLGSVQAPATPFPTSQEQQLLKPRRAQSDAESACELKKRERSS